MKKLTLNFKKMQRVLMEELRLMHYPIAIKFIFKDGELLDFTKNASYYEVVRPLTFCQFEIAARMKGQTVLGTREKLGCLRAAFVFGWRAYDDSEAEAHLKYVNDRNQAARFVKTKPRLPEGKLRAFVVSPLADTYFQPDVVHFYCDNLQAYHLLVDYMSAMDIHPLRPIITMNSAACAGNVFTYLEKSANLTTPCSGSYHSGKTERGETNVMIPGEHLEATLRRLLARIEHFGGASVTKPGDPFPGADICRNCLLIGFKKKKT